ncbi:MAG TPA: amidase [Chloroflexota bacterium]|nr:amidase [Chloroflexota bacterium]
MPEEPLHFQTIRQVGERIRRRELSPVELTTAIIDRSERLDGPLNAFITITREQALAQARSAEKAILAGHDFGPLHGIPISLKDLYQTVGVKTTGGSKILADWVPTTDATVTRRLTLAGAIVIGKNNLHEFAFGATNENPHYGPSRNPWNRERITGGSSGGSAAAVAAGLGYASMGSDTGGSIRLPAAFCGIVGVKPTYGLVSRAGVLPLSWSLDHCGPLTRTVEDAALMLNAIIGHDHADPASTSRVTPDLTTALDGKVQGLRVGVLREYLGENVNAEVASAVRTAARDLERLGTRVEEVSVPEVAYGDGASIGILYGEAAAIHERWLKTHRDQYGADVLERLSQGERMTATQYLKGQRARRVLVDRFKRLFEQIDVLISPTVPILAPTIPESRGNAARAQLLGFTRLFNVLGLPTLSVPCGFSTTGLPIGLQVAGRPFDDITILRVAHAYERQAGWDTHRPAV